MKVILTTSEILAKFGLSPDTELVIENSKSVEGSAKEESGGWISNIGRERDYHPDSLFPDTKIEVRYRDGDLAHGYAGDWECCWCEAGGGDCDIVAYRVLKV